MQDSLGANHESGRSAAASARPNRPPREPSRVFENISRSLSNARQAVSGFFARASAPRSQPPALSPPAPSPAPASSTSVILSSAPLPLVRGSLGSPILTGPSSAASSPAACAGPAPATRSSRLSASCLPFASFTSTFSSSADADEGSATTSLLADGSDASAAHANDEAAAEHDVVHGRRPSLWSSFTGLWRGNRRYAKSRKTVHASYYPHVDSRCAGGGARIRICPAGRLLEHARAVLRSDCSCAGL